MYVDYEDVTNFDGDNSPPKEDEPIKKEPISDLIGTKFRMMLTSLC